MTSETIGTINIINSEMFRVHTYSHGSQISITAADVGDPVCLALSTDEALLLIQHLASAIGEAQQQA